MKLGRTWGRGMIIIKKVMWDSICQNTLYTCMKLSKRTFLLSVKEESCGIFATCPAVQGQRSYFILSIFPNMQDGIPVALDRGISWNCNAYCNDLRFKRLQKPKDVLIDCSWTHSDTANLTSHMVLVWVCC